MIHRESKEMSVYALVAGKNGPKLKDAEPGSETPAAAPKDAVTIGQGSNQIQVSRNPGGGRGIVMTGGGRGGTMRMVPGENGGMRMEASKMAMPAFAEMLSGFAPRCAGERTKWRGDPQGGLVLSMKKTQRGEKRPGKAAIPAAIDPSVP